MGDHAYSRASRAAPPSSLRPGVVTGLWAWWWHDNLGLAPDQFLGIYHHAPPPELVDVGVHGHVVEDTYINEAIAFASANAAKVATWLRYLPL